MSSLFRIYMLLLSFSINLIRCYADWIDPDTPKDAYTTEPLVPRVPNLKVHDDEKATSSTTEHKIKHHRPTVSPKPTRSPMPSTSPTTTPTATPSLSPRTYHLVFSDEFNVEDRSFEDGADPRWTALEKNDYTNDALHYYSADNVRTNDKGQMVIKSEAADTEIIGFDDVKGKKTHVTKHFRSAMVQSWNKFCFTGGIVEAEVILPGKATVGGLWPAFWLLGNLARHTYVGSSQHVWPWSSVECTDKSRDSQLISGCFNAAHYGMEVGVGRGAPEIDIFEVQPGNIKANMGPFLKTPVGQPFMSASFQVAPGRPSNRPGSGEWPGPGQWYEGLKGGNASALNILFYGNYNHFRGDYDPTKSDYWSDAISFNRQLDDRFFTDPHKYRLEWQVPTDDRAGYLHWFLDEELVLAIDGQGLLNASLGSEISSEPSYILMNTAISSQWGFPKNCPSNCPCKHYDCLSPEWQLRCGFSEGFCDMMVEPDVPEYKINWVRVYQNPDDETEKVGCSTPERPTRKWIEGHESTYKTTSDLHPLKGIQIGRGRCIPGAEGETRESCGGLRRGRCTQGKVCECHEGWTGPHCLSHDGYDPIRYDVPDSILDVGFHGPQVAPFALLIAFCALVFLMIVTLRYRHYFDGYKAITDIKYEQIDDTMNGEHGEHEQLMYHR